MRIAIDLDTFTPKHLGALIAAMLTCGTVTREAIAHVTAPHFPNSLSASAAEAPIFDEPASDIHTMAFGTVVRGMLSRVKEAENSELTVLIAELNAEIYSRRVISPNDNPSAGVEKAASNGDAKTLTSLMPNFAASAPADLAEVFGMAAHRPTDAHVAGENQKSTDEHPSAFAKASTESTAANGVQLDKAGLPWNSRIHAASKAINETDGLWRRRRGVDPAVVVTVEAELRQAMSVPRGGEVAREEQPDGKITDVDPSDKGADVVKVPPPPPTVVTPAPDMGEIDSLPRLLKFITEQKLAGKLNQTQVNQALIAVGIEGPLPVLQARPDLIPTVAGKLRVLAGV